MIHSVMLSDTNFPELEAVLPIDRVVEIDQNNVTSLSDTQFIIDDAWIAKRIN